MTRAAVGGAALAALSAAGWWASARSHAAPRLPPPATAVAPDFSDAAGDGTPNFLRLADPADRLAFTGWFTFLAELQFFRESAELPAEVVDCAALVRFAYRESLRKHTGEWAAGLKLPDVPPLGTIRKYQYPFTPLGAALFNTPAGFAQFADAETLWRSNTHFRTREIAEASPGDLLFFHQPGQRFPYHVMIYVGRGRVRGDTGPFVVYHTGPDGKSPGEVRRPTVEELFAHPNPQWRPHEGNRHFLGVFRWNILNG